MSVDRRADRLSSHFDRQSIQWKVTGSWEWAFSGMQKISWRSSVLGLGNTECSLVWSWWMGKNTVLTQLRSCNGDGDGDYSLEEFHFKVPFNGFVQSKWLPRGNRNDLPELPHSPYLSRSVQTALATFTSLISQLVLWSPGTTLWDSQSPMR